MAGTTDRGGITTGLCTSWRFVLVQQEIAKAAQSFIEFPPMQKGASFNLEALKAELAKKMEEAKSHTGQ